MLYWIIARCGDWTLKNQNYISCLSCIGYVGCTAQKYLDFFSHRIFGQGVCFPRGMVVRWVSQQVPIALRTLAEIGRLVLGRESACSNKTETAIYIYILVCTRAYPCTVSDRTESSNTDVSVAELCLLKQLLWTSLWMPRGTEAVSSIFVVCRKCSNGSAGQRKGLGRAV